MTTSDPTIDRRPDVEALVNTAWAADTPPPVRERAREVAGLLPAPVAGGPGEAESGARIGPYEVEALLGAGGHARVYRAHHTETKEVYALKVPRPEVADRLLREARLLRRLDDPRIVRLLDVAPDGPTPYLVLECCEGGSLQGRIDESPGGMPLPEVVRVTEGILDALAAAHAAGVVHRDLKPQNVLFDERGRVKVCDFGIGSAALADEVAATLVSQRTRRAGTPLFMAPEQDDPRLRAGDRVDGRADLYALGKVIFCMLTGRRPQGFRPPSAYRKLHEAWDKLVCDLTAEKPDERPASAEAVLAPLAALPRAAVRDLGRADSLRADLLRRSVALRKDDEGSWVDVDPDLWDSYEQRHEYPRSRLLRPVRPARLIAVGLPCALLSALLMLGTRGGPKGVGLVFSLPLIAGLAFAFVGAVRLRWGRPRQPQRRRLPLPARRATRTAGSKMRWRDRLRARWQRKGSEGSSEEEAA